MTNLQRIHKEPTYAEYVRFCEERGYKPLSYGDPFWRVEYAVKSAPGDYDDETA